MTSDKSYIDRLRWLWARDGIKNQAEAGRAYGFNENTFRSITNGNRNLTPDQAQQIAAYHRVAAGWLLFDEGAPGERDLIPVSGYVGAGHELHLSGEKNGDFVSLKLGTPDLVAVEVRGDSMLPVYRDGDIVFAGPFSRSVDSVIGSECLVWLQDGRRLLKIVERGSSRGAVTLISWNAEPIRDVEMHSAGPVVAIKRNLNRVRRLLALAKSPDQAG